MKDIIIFGFSLAFIALALICMAGVFITGGESESIAYLYAFGAILSVAAAVRVINSRGI